MRFWGSRILISRQVHISCTLLQQLKNGGQILECFVEGTCVTAKKQFPCPITIPAESYLLGASLTPAG